MNQSERINIAKMLVVTYKIYSRDIDQDVAQLMVDDLNDLPFEDVMKALGDYRKDKKNRFAPNVADIIELVNPTVDDQTKAQHITGKVLEAVTKCGWQQQKEACEMIGPVGWAIVQRYGWEYLCENLGVDLSVSTFTAQLREGVKAELQISSAGRIGDDRLLDYSQPKQLSSMQSASDVLKTIMPKKDSI